MKLAGVVTFYTLSAACTVVGLVGLVLIAPAFACFAYHHSVRKWRRH